MLGRWPVLQLDPVVLVGQVPGGQDHPGELAAAAASEVRQLDAGRHLVGIVVVISVEARLSVASVRAFKES